MPPLCFSCLPQFNPRAEALPGIGALCQEDGPWLAGLHGAPPVFLVRDIFLVKFSIHFWGREERYRPPTDLLGPGAELGADFQAPGSSRYGSCLDAVRRSAARSRGDRCGGEAER